MPGDLVGIRSTSMRIHIYDRTFGTRLATIVPGDVMLLLALVRAKKRPHNDLALVLRQGCPGWMMAQELLRLEDPIDLKRATCVSAVCETLKPLCYERRS